MRIAIDRGDAAAARKLLGNLPFDVDTSDVQQRGIVRWRRYLEAELAGRIDEAAAIVVETVADIEEASTTAAAELLGDVTTYARRTGDHAPALEACRIVTETFRARRARASASQLHRARANAAAAAGDDAAAADEYALALANARNLGLAFWLAPVLHDYGAWLVSGGRHEEAAPLLAEARELFAGMGATAWLERVATLERAAPPPVEAAR